MSIFKIGIIFENLKQITRNIGASVFWDAGCIYGPVPHTDTMQNASSWANQCNNMKFAYAINV